MKKQDYTTLCDYERIIDYILSLVRIFRSRLNLLLKLKCLYLYGTVITIFISVMSNNTIVRYPTRVEGERRGKEKV